MFSNSNKVIHDNKMNVKTFNAAIINFEGRNKIDLNPILNIKIIYFIQYQNEF